MITTKPSNFKSLENEYLFKKINNRQNELQKLSQYLCQLESQLALIFASFPNIIIFLSSDLNILRVSSCVSNILGYSTEELVGTPIIDIIPKKQLPEFIEKIDFVLNSNKTETLTFVSNWLLKNNKTKKLKCQLTPCVGRENQIVGILSDSNS